MSVNIPLVWFRLDLHSQTAEGEGEDEPPWHLYDPVDDDCGRYLSVGSKKVIAFVF
jgi:hypothetical protein